MKKTILCLSILFGLFTLASCEETTDITYVDSNGETQTVKIAATEDKETVQAVFDFASKANYEDVSSIKLKESVSVSASLTKEMNESLALDTNTKLSASASMTMNLSLKDGIDISSKADASFGKDIKASGSADVIYEGELAKLPTTSDYFYISAGYDVKMVGNNSNASFKKAISPALILDEIESEIDDIIENFYPIDGPSEDNPKEMLSVEEFYDTFKNSKLLVSDVKGGVIYLTADFALKDLLLYVEDQEEIKPFLQLETRLQFTWGIDTSTGRFREFGFKFKDTSLLNLIALSLISEVPFDMPMPTLPKEFFKECNLESKITIEYDNAKIRSLTNEEKAEYSLLSM